MLLLCIVQLGRLSVRFLVSLPHSMISTIQATSKSTESVVYMARTEQTTVLHSRPTQRFQSCCCCPRAMCSESESMAVTNLVLGRHHLANVIDCAPLRKIAEVDALKSTSRNSLCVEEQRADWLCQLPSLASVASNCCLHL